MAEVAIPLIALGSMYILNNQNKKDSAVTREGLTNLGTTHNALPGVNPAMPAVNYPVLAPVSDANVKKYYNPNQTTDRFFNPNDYAFVDSHNSEFGVGGGVKPQYSLTGELINKKDFTHNNMVPFFGAKIRGATADRDVTESTLDNMQGQGSQLFRKREQAPLFQPQRGYQYANGTPNMSDFFQSRVNPSLKFANVTPWEQTQVAPALGKGFTAQGSNGFNSGLEARDDWLPKTVNELRVASHPKTTYALLGHEGPGDSYIKNSASIQTQGAVEKYRPDGFFVQSPDRWLTTVGLEKAQTARADEILRDVRSENTAQSYFGPSTQNEASYVPSASEPTKRHDLGPVPVTAMAAMGMATPTEADYGVQGFNSLPNNRSTTRHTGEYATVGNVIKAAIAPIMDILRPSRKEDVVCAPRQSGNATAPVTKGTVFNPADRTKTTLREMTEGRIGMDHLNVENQSANAYLVTAQQPIPQNRDTTEGSYTGTSGPAGAYNVPRSYEAEYMQHNNVNKTYPNRPNQGNMGLMSTEQNIHINKLDCDRNNNRWWVPSSGNVAGITNPPSKENYGSMHVSYQYEDYKMNAERMNPDILQAFKSNPYTQSLSSWA
jgi:hypothetical protein